jgi:hypothetical protein
LNHANRFVRAAGTLLVAICLAFIVLSICWAATDCTFAPVQPGNLRPLLLNAQAVVALAAIAFLLWAHGISSVSQVEDWRDRAGPPNPWSVAGRRSSAVSHKKDDANPFLVTES